MKTTCCLSFYTILLGILCLPAYRFADDVRLPERTVGLAVVGTVAVQLEVGVPLCLAPTHHDTVQYGRVQRRIMKSSELRSDIYCIFLFERTVAQFEAAKRGMVEEARIWRLAAGGFYIS